MFVYANSNAADFFDTNREDLLGQNLLSMHPFDSRFSEAYNKAMIENVSVTYDSRSPDQARWIEVRGYPVDGGMACYFTDITDRVTSQERITFMALHDSLTRLPNRRYLQEELIRAVARGKRGTVSALLFMDMDRFKIVNDTVGHAAGDAVLLEFAGVVASCVREEDMFARFGGDEFALLLGGANAEDGLVIGDRIKQAVVEHEFRVGSHRFSLGVSIGMTLVDGTLDEGHVMALADDAMYEAKTSGGEHTHYRAPDAKPDPAPEG
jgi:diguanylate cyclase (GGDEF)-like protein